VTLIAVTFGTYLAWVVERTNAPLRNFIFLLSVIRLIVPGLFLTIAWTYILGPRGGIFNLWLMDLFGLTESPFNLYSLPGMIFIEGLQGAPIPFLLMAAALRSMDPALEEAARTSGAGLARTVRQVTLPLVRPAFLAAVLITFITAFEGFETPVLIGLAAEEPIRTFSNQIYLNAKQSPTNYNVAGAYSLVFLLMALVGVYLYRRATRMSERFATVTGKAFRADRIDLGPWRWPATALALLLVSLMFAIPVAALAWRSIQPYANAPTLETIQLITLSNWEFVLGYHILVPSLANSLLIALATAMIVMAVAAVASWLVTRSRVRGRGALDAAIFLPIAMPSLVVGLGLALFALNFAVFLYGTLLIIALSHTIRFLPYGFRFATASMTQIHPELEGAAYTSGATFAQTFRRVIVPLLMSGLVAGFTFVFVGSVRELGSAVMLYGLGTQTYPVALFDVFGDGRFGEAAAMALVGVVALAVLVLSFRFIGSRFGLREQT
jgi:iron(III) transport system permease protein